MTLEETALLEALTTRNDTLAQSLVTARVELELERRALAKLQGVDPFAQTVNNDLAPIVIPPYPGEEGAPDGELEVIEPVKWRVASLLFTGDAEQPALVDGSLLVEMSATGNAVSMPCGGVAAGRGVFVMSLETELAQFETRLAGIALDDFGLAAGNTHIISCSVRHSTEDVVLDESLRLVIATAAKTGNGYHLINCLLDRSLTTPTRLMTGADGQAWSVFEVQFVGDEMLGDAVLFGVLRNASNASVSTPSLMLSDISWREV